MIASPEVEMAKQGRSSLSRLQKNDGNVSREEKDVRLCLTLRSTQSCS